MTTLRSSLRWRAAFTFPGGQSVTFHWFDAANADEAREVADAYAKEHRLDDCTVSLWCPEAE